MAGEIAAAYVSLLPSFKGGASAISKEMSPGLTQAGKDGSKKFGSTFLGGMKGIAATAAGLFAFSAVKGFFSDAFDEAQEAIKVGAQTEAVIKSTGGAAKLTADQIGDLATALSLKTGIDDEAIQSGENVLLTFKNIRDEAGRGNDIFSQTTSIMTDMSAALGQDMKSSAIQLGKALNDPIRGVTALQRVGVTFTDAQKKQIKALVESGDVMGAQKIILGELKSEFEGSAEAIATPADKAKVAWGNFKELIGTKLMPIVDRVLTGLTKGIGWLSDAFSGANGAGAAMASWLAPVGDLAKRAFGLWKKYGPQIVSTVRDAVVKAVDFLRDVITKVVGAIVKWIKDNRDTWQEWGAKIKSTVGSVRTIIGTLIAWLVKGWREHGDEILAALRKVLDGAKTAVGGVISALAAVFKFLADHEGVVKALATVLAGAYAGFQAFKSITWIIGVFSKVRGAILGINAAMAANPIGLLVVALGALVAGLIYAYNHSETFRKIVQKAWEVIRTAAQFAWEKVIKPVIEAYITYIGLLIDAAVGLWHGLQAAWDAIVTGVTTAWGWIRSTWDKGVSFVTGIPGRILGALSGMWDFISSQFGKVKDGVVAVAGGLLAYVSELPGKIFGFFLSLPKKYYELGKTIVLAIWNGIKSLWNAFWNWFKDKLSWLPFIGGGSGDGGGGGSFRQAQGRGAGGVTADAGPGAVGAPAGAGALAAQAQADALDVLQGMGFGRMSRWKAREDYDLVRALKRIAESPPQTVLNIERPIDEPASTTLGKLADFARVVSR